ncbi:MAG: Lrp/AsnC family transcriptional regulator [Candidatus Woesearchaeota archaeon]
MKFLFKETYRKDSPIKLSTTDKKLIQLLLIDARTPLKTLAKQLHVSEPAIHYKIKSLQEKQILLTPVTYPNIQLLQNPFYIAEVSTLFGSDTLENIKKIQSIKEIAIQIWYSGPYNLIFSIQHEQPLLILQKIHNIIPIKNYRLRKVINMWYNPPHLFYNTKKHVSYTTNTPILNERQKEIFSYLTEHPLARILEIHHQLGYATKTIQQDLLFLSKDAIRAILYLPNAWACQHDIISTSFKVIGDIPTLIQQLLVLPQTKNVWVCDHEWNLNVAFWVKNPSELTRIIAQLEQQHTILDVDYGIATKMIGKL